MGNIKTNAMCILDKAEISYNTYTYDHSDGLVDGITVADKIGQLLQCVGHLHCECWQDRISN